MYLIINHSSMQPIYEQIVEQIKEKIINGEFSEEMMLPSVRTMAKDLKISALTVKKAYDALTEEGFVVTVHGKGSFVAWHRPPPRRCTRIRLTPMRVRFSRTMTNPTDPPDSRPQR